MKFFEKFCNINKEDRPMKKRFLTILTATILILGVAGTSASAAQAASIAPLSVDLPGNIY
jgi:conjugal transfer/entry exclusion protein